VPQHARVRFIKQVAAAVRDLTARRAQPQVAEYGQDRRGAKRAEADDYGYQRHFSP